MFSKVDTLAVFMAWFYRHPKKKIGRPAVLGPAELATLRRLVDEGASVTDGGRQQM